MLVNNSLTFHEDILNGFSSYRTKEWTALYSVLGIAKIQRGISNRATERAALYSVRGTAKVQRGKT